MNSITNLKHLNQKTKNLTSLSFVLLLPFFLFADQFSQQGLKDKKVSPDIEGAEIVSTKKSVSSASKTGNKYEMLTSDQLARKKEVLEKTLKFGSHKERKAAMREMVGMPEDQSGSLLSIVSEIIENDLDNSVKIAALHTLMNMNGVVHSRTIIGSLKDKSIEVKEASIMVIQKLKIEEATPALFELLKDQDFTKNSRMSPLIINALADIDTDKLSFSFLETKLRSASTAVELKGSIALYFGKANDLRAEQVLIKIATDDTEDIIVRSYCINSLGKIQSVRSIEHIRNILKDIDRDSFKAGSKKYSSLKLYAMSALVALGDKNILQELISYSKDDDPNVRLRAIQQLSELKEPSIVELIEYKALRDPNKKVQKAAKDILEKIKKEQREAAENANKTNSIEKIEIDSVITEPKTEPVKDAPKSKLIESFEKVPHKKK
jgi:HEAT repeat protein